jgi:hypothetical protein
MNMLRRLPFLCALLLASPNMAMAADAQDSLPPEKLEMIYEALLPSEEQIPPADGISDTPAPVSDEHAEAAERIAGMMRKRGINLHGRPGQWEFEQEGRQLFLLLDFERDRVRLATPLASLDQLRASQDFSEAALFEKLLKANYVATEELRFALNRQVVWLTYLHPLGSLDEGELTHALDQVAVVARRAEQR